jgi:hypothetical protein
MGMLPPRYSFVLNPHVGERFTKCPVCDASTRIRKLPLVVPIEHPGGPRLVLLNKICRLCVICETLIVDRVELESVIVAAGLCPAIRAPDYVVLGTIERRTWRRSLGGNAALPDIREHMADFKEYVKVDVVPGAERVLPEDASRHAELQAALALTCASMPRGGCSRADIFGPVTARGCRPLLPTRPRHRIDEQRLERLKVMDAFVVAQRDADYARRGVSRDPD